MYALPVCGVVNQWIAACQPSRIIALAVLPTSQDTAVVQCSSSLPPLFTSSFSSPPLRVAISTVAARITIGDDGYIVYNLRMETTTLKANSTKYIMNR